MNLPFIHIWKTNVLSKLLQCITLKNIQLNNWHCHWTVTEIFSPTLIANTLPSFSRNCILTQVTLKNDALLKWLPFKTFKSKKNELLKNIGKIIQVYDRNKLLNKFYRRFIGKLPMIKTLQRQEVQLIIVRLLINCIWNTLMNVKTLISQ